MAVCKCLCAGRYVQGVHVRVPRSISGMDGIGLLDGSPPEVIMTVCFLAAL